MFADPTKIVSQFGLKPGMVVADLGCGTGAMSFAASKVISSDGMTASGKVYSIEVQKELLVRLKKDAEERQTKNIEIIWGNIEKLGGTKIADHKADAAIVSNVLFQVEDKMTFLKEVERILKPDGRVFLVDWSDSFSSMGPHGDSVITKDTAKGLFEKSGFSYDSEIEAGSHHYGLVFRKLS